MIPRNKYQTGGLRFVAALIDGIILLPVFVIDVFMQIETVADAVYIPWVILSSQVFWIYSVTLHAKYGQTIGKRCVGVKVVNHKDEASITWKQAFLRDLPYILLVFLFLAVLGYYWVLFYTDRYTDEHDGQMEVVDFIFRKLNFIWFSLEVVTMLSNAKRRAIHDFIAGTVVIKKKPW